MLDFYEWIVFAPTGFVWGVATASAYCYLLACPPAESVARFGRPTCAFFAGAAIIQIVGGMASTCGSLLVLRSEPFWNMVERTQQTDGNDGMSPANTFNDRAFEFDSLLGCVGQVSKWALCTLCVSVSLHYTLGVCPMFCITLVFTLGTLMLNDRGQVPIRKLVLFLSERLVDQFIVDIDEGIQADRDYDANNTFWQAMTEEHRSIDIMLEQLWENAVWIFGPYFFPHLHICGHGFCGQP